MEHQVTKRNKAMYVSTVMRGGWGTSLNFQYLGSARDKKMEPIRSKGSKRSKTNDKGQLNLKSWRKIIKMLQNC